MKKIYLLSTAILASTVLGGGMPTVQAEEGAKPEQQLKSIVDIEFMTDESGETIPDPTAPGGSEEIIDPAPGGVVPDEKGPLMINYVPNFDFGKHVIATKGFAVYANISEVNTASGTTQVPHFAQVTDIRGTHAGWDLSVSASDLSLNGQGEKSLDGVSMILNPVTLDSVGGADQPTAASSQTVNFPQGSTSVMTAKENTGEGTWSASFGSEEQFIEGKNTGVVLDVPAKAASQASIGKYQAILTWNLAGHPTLSRSATPSDK